MDIARSYNVSHSTIFRGYPHDAVILYRTDRAKNVHRFYRLGMQPDLFGQWCLMREWGRIGSAGQTRSLPFPTSHEAQAALDKQRIAKQGRGHYEYCKG